MKQFYKVSNFFFLYENYFSSLPGPEPLVIYYVLNVDWFLPTPRVGKHELQLGRVPSVLLLQSSVAPVSHQTPWWP